MDGKLGRNRGAVCLTAKLCFFLSQPFLGPYLSLLLFCYWVTATGSSVYTSCPLHLTAPFPAPLQGLLNPWFSGETSSCPVFRHRELRGPLVLSLHLTKEKSEARGDLVQSEALWWQSEAWHPGLRLFAWIVLDAMYQAILRFYLIPQTTLEYRHYYCALEFQR